MEASMRDEAKRDDFLTRVARIENPFPIQRDLLRKKRRFRCSL